MAHVRRLAAIMFTDMVGFTAATQRHEATALELLREQEAIARPILERHAGRHVKSTGDGALVEFPSALQAAEGAVELLSKVHELNAARPSRAIQLRIGIHVGDVEVRNGDIFGDAVNIAARILSVAEPEGIAMSESVATYLANKLTFPIQPLGTRGLKGVGRPVAVFRVTLPWSGPARVEHASSQPRVAVLPLRNISPDPHDEYFADGLTEELISVLGRVTGLRVIARSSVDRFWGKSTDTVDIGRALGATAILEGSVRKAGDRLRISLHLVDVASQEGLWSQTFDRQLTDVFAVQSEVGERTAASLRVHLAGDDRTAVRRRPTDSLAAFSLYLQGVHQTREPGREHFTEAVRLFREAIRTDPRFAVAHAALAHILIGAIGERLPAREVVPEARHLVEQALALDPACAAAHAARANLAMQADLDWSVADAEFQSAIRLNPSDSGSRAWYGILLRALQRYEEAEVQLRAAAELDPMDTGARALIGSVLRLTGRWREAVDYTRAEFAPLESSDKTHISLAYSLFYGGELEEARREMELASGSDDPGVQDDLAVLYAAMGDRSRAQRLYASLRQEADARFVPANRLVVLAVGSGDQGSAFAMLEKDWSEGDRGLWFIYQGLGLDGIRRDPRFSALLKRYGLPTSAPFYDARRKD